MTESMHSKIDKLIIMLGDPRIARSTRAEQRLIVIGRDAFEPLVEAAASASWNVRSRVAWILGAIGDNRAYETILALTQDPHDFVRYEAAWALGKLGDERAIEPLIALAAGTDDGGRVVSAANGLSEVRDRALSRLIEVAKSESAQNRRMAVLALGGSGDERAIATLSELLRDSDEFIRETAVSALEECGVDHVDQLGQRCLDLIRPYLDDDDNDVAWAADEGIEALTKALEGVGSTRKSPRAHKLRLITGRKRADMKLKARCARLRYFGKLHREIHHGE